MTWKLEPKQVNAIQELRNADHPMWREALKNASGDEHFAEWLVVADAACHKLGVSLWDLPDGPSRDSYDDGVNPAAYARSLIRGELG